MVSWPEDFANAVFDGTREDLAANPAEAHAPASILCPSFLRIPVPGRQEGTRKRKRKEKETKSRRQLIVRIERGRGKRE